MLSALAILALARYATAQDNWWGDYEALSDKMIPYDERPYKVDTLAEGRGPQWGYNNCTEEETGGPDSLCQTAFVNSLEDFCLWGLPVTGETVGDSEARSVAYCTNPVHGTRVIPPGAITGAQFIQTEKYIQVTGNLDQTALNIAADDPGGEMDPMGADMKGNPLGGLMYTTAFSRDNQPQQSRYWTNFMGNNQFCIKVCIPEGEDARQECEHIYDRIGCAYNVYADYANLDEKFESCEGEVGLYQGVYVGEDGRTSTYTQPAESLGAITTIPYTVSIPPSSRCNAVATDAAPSAFALAGRSFASGSAAESSAAEETESAEESDAEETASAATSGVANNAASARPTVGTDPDSAAFPIAAVSSLLVASSAAVLVLLA